MNYDQFRAIWQEVLAAAGLLPLGPYPTETVDLTGSSRQYSSAVEYYDRQRTGPFHVTAALSWQWNAALSARMVTTEEDLLRELLGRGGRYLNTERPWLRVDAVLRAMRSPDSLLPLPGRTAWQRWTTDVLERLIPLLPTMSAADLDEGAVLAWRGTPAAQVRCGPTGQLYLEGVELPAWQGIELPRQWDHPDRERDDGPEAQLADFARRLRAALPEWEASLVHLQAGHERAGQPPA